MKYFLSIFVVLMCNFCYAATPDIVPRLNDEGRLGNSTKRWNAVTATTGNFTNINDTVTVITNRLDNLSSSTTTLQTNINNLYINVTATHSALTTAINSTFTGLTNNYVTAINSSHTALTNSINSTNTALTNLIQTKVSTVGFYLNGTLVGGASNFNLTGSAVTSLTIDAGTATATITDTGEGGGGSVSFTTKQVILDGGDGDIFVSSLTFRGLTGVFTVGQSTVHLVDMRVFFVGGSTVGGSEFKLAKSTGGLNYSPWKYIAQSSVNVSVPNVLTVNSSSWTTFSELILYPNESVSLHATDLPDSGTMPYGVYVIFRFWREENEKN